MSDENIVEISSQGEVTFKKGIFLLSWDFELAWGVHDLDNMPNHLNSSEGRDTIVDLISILNDREIPSTWATVGHLFLSSCNKTENGKHPEVKSPGENWYNSDPSTDIQTDPLWYAPDIIKLLLQAETDQEIGCHTFSHVTTDVDHSIVRSEIQRCKALAPEEVSLSSFIAPRHSPAPVKILSELGFLCYREPIIDSGVTKAVKFYSGIGAPKTDVPSLDAHGLWRIPVGSYFFYEPIHQIPRKFPRLKLQWFRRGLERAINKNQIFHVWAHPHEFIARPSALNLFSKLLQMVNEYKRKGEIIPMTMGRLSKELNEELNTEIDNTVIQTDKSR